MKPSEEKSAIYQSWYGQQTFASAKLFEVNDATYRMTPEIESILAQSTGDAMYLYIMEHVTAGLRMPLYIGKSNTPMLRWRSHLKKLNTSSTGSYIAWRRAFDTLPGAVGLSVIAERAIRSAPLRDFPSSVGAVEYQLVALASGFSPLLLNLEGNAR